MARYNAAEAQRANMQRWRVLGRDFRELVGPDGEQLSDRIARLLPGGRAFMRGIFRRYRSASLVTIEIQRTVDGAYLLIHPIA